MAVIQDYYNGNCHIVVHDDYIIRDPVEVQKIIDRVSRVVINEEFRRYVQSQEKQKEETA